MVSVTPDHDHHPDEQADRVEVDRLDRLLLVERAGEHDQRRAQQGDLGAVDALGRDQREGDDEDCDGEGHGSTSGVDERDADQASRHTAESRG